MPPQHCACVAAGEARQAMQTASQCAGMRMVGLDDAHDLVGPSGTLPQLIAPHILLLRFHDSACLRQGASGAAAPRALGGLAARVAQSQRGGGARLVGVVARPARFRQLAERGLFPLVAVDGVSFLRLDLGAPLGAQGHFDAVLVKVRCGHMGLRPTAPARQALSIENPGRGQASDELECSESGAAPALSARLRALEPRLQAQHVRMIDSLPAISQARLACMRHARCGRGAGA